MTSSSGTAQPDRQQLAKAINMGLNIDPSSQVLDEVFGLCVKEDGKGLNYRDFAECEIRICARCCNQLTRAGAISLNAKSELFLLACCCDRSTRA